MSKMRKKPVFHEAFTWAPGGLMLRKRTCALAKFVRAVSSRYLSRTELLWRTFAAVLRRSARGVTIQVNRREGDLHFSPNLRLLMLPWGKSGESTHPRDALKPILRLTTANDAPTLRPRSRQIPAESPARDRFLRHLTAQRERRESLFGAGIRSTALLAQGGRAKTPPKESDEQAQLTTLKRFQPLMRLIEMEKRSQQIGSPSAKAEPQPMGPALKPRPAHAPLDVDVNHLADRVIQAIDRRIIAQRERLGRA